MKFSLKVNAKTSHKNSIGADTFRLKVQDAMSMRSSSENTGTCTTDKTDVSNGNLLQVQDAMSMRSSSENAEYLGNDEKESSCSHVAAAVSAHPGYPVPDLLEDGPESTHCHLMENRAYSNTTCFHENLALVTPLIGPKINSRNTSGQTCLHVAAENGHLGSVEELFKNGAKLDHVNQEGLTPLHVCAIKNHTDVAFYLIRNGASVNKQDYKSNLPLHHAVRCCNGPLISALIEAGSKTDILNSSFDSPLHIATTMGHVPTIKLLLDLGCDVNISKPDGATPLHCLVSTAIHTSKFCLILEMFLSAGCYINQQAFNTLETPLYKAIISEKEQFAEMLLSYGADPNISSPFDMTALQFASINQYTQAAVLMLHCGIQWKRERWLQYLAGIQVKDCNSAIGMIQSWKSEPVRLINLCRISFRNHYREKLFCVVDKLNLPKRVKKFLLLHDLLMQEGDWAINLDLASGIDKMTWASCESEECSDVLEIRKNEDEDICDE